MSRTGSKEDDHAHITDEERLTERSWKYRGEGNTRNTRK